MKKLLFIILTIFSLPAFGQTYINGSTGRFTAYNGILRANGTSALTTVTSTTIGLNILGSTNPGAIRFGRANADNTFDWLSAADFRTAIGVSSVSFGTSDQIPHMNTGGTGFDYSSDFRFDGTNILGNGIAPVSTSSGLALRNNAGTAIATLGVGSSSSTSSTWTGNTNITGDWDITGSLDVDNINVNGNTISSSNTNGNVNIDPNGNGVIDIASDLQVSETNFTIFKTVNTGFSEITGGTGTDDVGLKAYGSGHATKANQVVIQSNTTDGIRFEGGGGTLGATISAGTGDLKIINGGAITVNKTTNQIVLGTTNTTTINSTAPSASRVYTIPDFGSDDTFTGIAATQTLTNKTLTSPVINRVVGITNNTNYEQKLVKNVSVTDNVATDVLALTLPSGSNMAGSYIVEITALISDITGTAGTSGNASSKFYKGYINYSQGATANGGTIIEVEQVESTSSASTAGTKDIGVCSFTTTKSGTDNSIHTVSFTINSTGTSSSDLRCVFSFEIMARGFTTFSAN